MSQAEQILQAIRTSNLGKVFEELQKLERFVNRYPHLPERRIFLDKMLKLFTDAKSDKKPS